MIHTQLSNSVVTLYTYCREIVISAQWASLTFLNRGKRIAAPGNPQAAKYTWEASCTRSLARRSSDVSVLPAPRRSGKGWRSPLHPSQSPLLGALALPRQDTVHARGRSWLKAERMENVRCCFCLTLGTDPAEIITEEFTLPCQICRYFAVLRFDALFL